MIKIQNKINNSYVQNALGGLLQPVSGVLIAIIILAYASPDAYGSYVYIITIVFLINSLKDLGFVEYAYSVSENTFSSCNIIYIELIILAAMMALLITLNISGVIQLSPLAILTIAIMAIIRSFIDFMVINLRREEKYKNILFKDAAVNVARPCLVFFLLSNAPDSQLEAMLVAAISATLVELFALTIGQSQKNWFKPNLHQLLEGKNFALHILTQKVSAVLGARIDILILGNLLSPNILGQYSLATQISRNIPPIPIGRIQEVILTKLVKKKMSPCAIYKKTHYITMAYLSGAVFFSLIIHLISMGNPEFKWGQALLIMQIFSFMWPFHALGLPIGPITRFHQKVSILTSSLILKSISNIILILILAPLGATAVAFGNVLLNALINTVNRLSLRKHLSYDITKPEVYLFLISFVWATVMYSVFVLDR